MSALPPPGEAWRTEVQALMRQGYGFEDISVEMKRRSRRSSLEDIRAEAARLEAEGKLTELYRTAERPDPMAEHRRRVASRLSLDLDWLMARKGELVRAGLAWAHRPCPHCGVATVRVEVRLSGLARAICPTASCLRIME